VFSASFLVILTYSTLFGTLFLQLQSSSNAFGLEDGFVAVEIVEIGASARDYSN
jgi:hypothetical protein